MFKLLSLACLILITIISQATHKEEGNDIITVYKLPKGRQISFTIFGHGQFDGEIAVGRISHYGGHPLVGHYYSRKFDTMMTRQAVAAPRSLILYICIFV